MLPQDRFVPIWSPRRDLAPGFLQLVGLDIPSSMAGTSFAPCSLHPEQSIRPFAFAEKHWHDYEDHSRAVRSSLQIHFQ